MNTKYYKTGGFTIEVHSDLPFKKDTYLPKFSQFEVDGPGKENIIINHHFTTEFNIEIPPKNRFYQKFPWDIYKLEDNYIYEYKYDKSENISFFRKMITNSDHTVLDIYHNSETKNRFLKETNTSLTLFPNDQIFLAKVLSHRKGCIFHSTGIIHNDSGYLFVGHSDEGKSTIAEIMANNSIILCDDRNIVRKSDTGYRVYGTWYHSDFPEISSTSAPLRAIFFLNQSQQNQIQYIDNVKKRFHHLIGRVIKPLATREWWERTFDLIENISNHVDCLDLKFDKSGEIRELIKNL